MLRWLLPLPNHPRHLLPRCAQPTCRCRTSPVSTRRAPAPSPCRPAARWQTGGPPPGPARGPPDAPPPAEPATTSTPLNFGEPRSAKMTSAGVVLVGVVVSQQLHDHRKDRTCLRPPPAIHIAPGQPLTRQLRNGPATSPRAVGPPCRPRPSQPRDTRRNITPTPHQDPDLNRQPPSSLPASLRHGNSTQLTTGFVSIVQDAP